MGTARCSTDGQRLGRAATAGVKLRGAFVEFPAERAYLSTRGNAEIFALEIVIET